MMTTMKTRNGQHIRNRNRNRSRHRHRNQNQHDIHKKVLSFYSIRSIFTFLIQFFTYACHSYYIGTQEEAQIESDEEEQQEEEEEEEEEEKEEETDSNIKNDIKRLNGTYTSR
jgi:amino acid permease